MKVTRGLTRGSGATRGGRLRLALVVLLVLAAGAAASLLAAAPAAAFSAWEHDGTFSCQPCHQNGAVAPNTCTQCHMGWAPVPTYQCWSCHVPGADTAPLAADCGASCHLWSESTRSYSIAFSHGAAPHLGADFAPCTSCHTISGGAATADRAGVHHSGVTLSPPTCLQCHDGVTASAKENHDAVTPVCEACHTGMDIPNQATVCTRCHSAATFGSATCTACHSVTGVFGRETVHTTTPSAGVCTDCHAGYQKHAAKVACTQCHTKAAAFHHQTAATAGKKVCTTCHAKRHAGHRIALAKCAACHKGNAPAAKPRVQHSSKITRAKKCAACHDLRAHASAVRSSITCQTCHKGKFHGMLTLPGSGACLTCHSAARSHAVGYPCLICHRVVVHDPTPHAGSVRSAL